MTRFLSLAPAALLGMAASLSAVPAEPVVTEALVNAPVEAVWEAWTTKAGLEAWLVGKTEIDLKVGGVWLNNYSRDSDLKDDSTIHQSILAFDPGRMLAFRTTKTPTDFPFAAVLQTWTVIYFEPAGRGKTRVLARMHGFGDDEPSQRARAFFERGNRSELDKLVKFFENGIPAVVR